MKPKSRLAPVSAGGPARDVPPPSVPPEGGEFAQLIRTVLRKSGEATLYTVGNSMLPLIPPGSRVLIRPVTHKLLRVGDIVVVWSADCATGLKLHRIVYLAPSRDELHTTGDNGLVVDPPVAIDQMIARAQYVLRPNEEPVDLGCPSVRLSSLVIVAAYRFRRLLVKHNVRFGRRALRGAWQTLIRLMELGLR